MDTLRTWKRARVATTVTMSRLKDIMTEQGGSGRSIPVIVSIVFFYLIGIAFGITPMYTQHDHKEEVTILF